MVPRLADANALAALAGELVRAVSASYRIASHSLPCSRRWGWPGGWPPRGGRRFRLVDASMRRQVRQDFARHSRFREALQQGGLVLFFQPIVDLIKGWPLGFESLARWRDQDGHDHVRSEFLPVARQISLSGELDLVVISQVLAALPALVAATGPAVVGPLLMSVNLSAQLLAATSRGSGGAWTGGPAAAAACRPADPDHDLVATGRTPPELSCASHCGSAAGPPGHRHRPPVQTGWWPSPARCSSGWSAHRRPGRPAQPPAAP